jgi:two-component system, cell cycle response regulator CpdR
MARTVLVVDDEPAVLEVVASMLEDLGCKVVTALNATDALELLAENEQIEVLFTDVNMPGMCGYELGDKARSIRADLQVMLLSGRESDGRGYPMVRKPFAIQDLARAMQHTTGMC